MELVRMAALDAARITSIDVDPDRPLWGIEAIAEVVCLTPRQAQHALNQGYLPADKAGRRWVSTPRRLRNRFAGALAGGLK
jgi:hypothetical protein